MDSRGSWPLTLMGPPKTAPCFFYRKSEGLSFSYTPRVHHPKLPSFLANPGSSYFGHPHPFVILTMFVADVRITPRSHLHRRSSSRRKRRKR